MTLTDTRFGPAISGAPSEWAFDTVLSDGATVHIRPIVPADGPGLAAFHTGLSAESQRLRFFTPKPELTELEVARFTGVDYRDRMALVAELGGAIIAVGRYDRMPGTTDAEVAFSVTDRHQHRGLGTLLLEFLAAHARTQGVTRFQAETLYGNQAMLGVFRRAGFAETSRGDHGVVEVTLDIEPTGEALRAVEEREWSAGVRSMQRLLRPRSVAVVGAGRSPSSLGHRVVRNLIDGGFSGDIFPINPAATEIAGLPAHPSIVAAGRPVDLAVIAVPAAAALNAVADCAAAGVGGLVVVSSGFAEVGVKGRAMERALVAAAHAAGMRVVGPNCIGVINTAPDVLLDATFAGRLPLAGNVGFASQSGALGIALLERSAALGLGISAFVSMGNKADVSGNDLLRYFAEDPATAVVLLYLESFGNPRRFAQVARRTARRKPIVAMKAGRSSAGRRAAASHTASMASPDIAVDALFLQAGVIRVDTVEQMLDAGSVLSSQPLPSGRRVGIVGNAGGAGILAADACAAAGLEVPELDDAVRSALRAIAGPNAGVGNPIDLGAGATADVYGRSLEALLAGDSVDALIVVLAPVPHLDADDVARAVRDATDRHRLPVTFIHLGRDDAPDALRAGDHPVPSLPFPERAAIALGHAADHASWRRRPEGSVPRLDGVDREAADRVVAGHLTAVPDGGWMESHAAQDLLAAFGVPLTRGVFAGGAADAGDLVRGLGGPAAMKVVADGVLHKSDAGGVALNIRTAAAAVRQYRLMERRLGAAMRGVMIQPMASPGVELIAGVVSDDLFGPLIMFGSGGTAVEVLGDRAFRILPLTDLDATELVRSIKGAALLAGHRGAPAADIGAVEDLLLRLAHLAECVPQIAELDLNPVIASPTGCTVVDARIRVVPYRARPEETVRRLR